MSDSSPGSVLCPQRSRNVLPGLLWLLTETMRHIRSSRADAKKSCPVGTSQWPPVCGGSSGWTSSAGCGGGRRPCDPSCEQLYHGPFWICSTACQLIGSLPQAVSVHRTRCVYRGSGQALARGHVDQAQIAPSRSMNTNRLLAFRFPRLSGGASRRKRDCALPVLDRSPAISPDLCQPWPVWLPCRRQRDSLLGW